MSMSEVVTHLETGDGDGHAECGQDGSFSSVRVQGGFAVCQDCLDAREARTQSKFQKAESLLSLDMSPLVVHPGIVGRRPSGLRMVVAQDMRAAA